VAPVLRYNRLVEVKQAVHLDFVSLRPLRLLDEGLPGLRFCLLTNYFSDFVPLLLCVLALE
jgi:hypothetical protein